MKKINIKNYIYQHKIRSTLFILKATKHGGIPDGTKRTIRKLRNRVGNIRFVLLSEKIPPIKETFDLVITDEVSSALVEKVKKIVKFNHLLVIYKGHIFDTHKNGNFKTIEIPLTQESDLNRVIELQRLRGKHSMGQLAGRKVGHYIGVGVVGAILLLPSLIVAIILGQYNPASMFYLEVENNKSQKVQYDTKYSALTYNTGFTAYNQDMHFYMDCPSQKIWGGQGTAESKEAVNASLAGIRRIIADQKHDTGEVDKEIIDSTADVKSYELKGSRIYKTLYDDKSYTVEGETYHYYPRRENSDSWVSTTEESIAEFNKSLNQAGPDGEGDGLFDFIALQEQDINCPKSYNTNQPQIIKDTPVVKDNTTYKLSDIYNSTFALNFSTPFIPIPLNDMFGKTVGGLSTFARYYSAAAQRFALENIKTFPLNLFEMKRCLSANWYPIGNAAQEEDQKYFVFINAHLAAYDSGGTIRRAQLQQLNAWLKQLDDWGYYYIVAADWNQILPDTRGYEGNNALTSEYSEAQKEEFKNDNPVMPWDYLEFKAYEGNPKDPNREKDFILPEEYNPEKSYKVGDLVKYTAPESLKGNYQDLEPNVDAPGHNGPITQYMGSVLTHNYQAMVDNPDEPPVDPTTGIKSSQWRYSLSNDAVYKDASLNDYVRSTLLSRAYTNESGLTNLQHYYAANANFYTTHAITTLRNAGEQFRNESRWAVGHTYKATIDGFLVSRNIKVHQTIGFDTNYKYSDHNPVAITFEFVKQ